MGARFLVAAALASLVGASCLPVDTREPPGSILLTVTSADEPSVTTADGWSITVDRLLLGMGDARLDSQGSGSGCTPYSTAYYRRLLDGRIPGDQKLGIIFGLGRCNFYFRITWPDGDALLGEGVTEVDKELMAGPGGFGGPRGGPEVPGGTGGAPTGTAIDFAATATRGPETKRVHWKLRQGPADLMCSRGVPPEPSQPIELRSDVDLTFHIGIRGVALFGDNAPPDRATLRFDSIAAADTIYGNDDGEITLDELGKVSLDVARQHGPYGSPGTSPWVPGSASLEDYMYRELLAGLVRMREEVTCSAAFGFQPPRPPRVSDASADEGGPDQESGSVERDADALGNAE